MQKTIIVILSVILGMWLSVKFSYLFSNPIVDVAILGALFYFAHKAKATNNKDK